MIDRIKEKIRELEKQENINILFACESGSRAWKFPSPDSDYDVRIIYSRPLEWYLTIYEGRDVVETPLINNFDVGGWDLKKTLKLIHKSNAVVWEWLQSPIIYREQDSFKNSLLRLAKDYFSPISAFHHYFSMAQKVNGDLEGNSKIKLKKIFYVIRPLLAARWIAEGKGIPPMDLPSLLDVKYVASEQKDTINKLVGTKSKVNESYMIDRVPIIDDFIVSNIKACESKAGSIDSIKKSSDQLDIFFKEMVQV